MSENTSPSFEDRALAQAVTAQLSGGTMLRKAREAEGLHIAALAVSLKVPVKKLEALEAERFDLLPDIVFVRALAASVCRTLKIDPDPILERLPHITAPHLKTDESGINVPYRASGDGSGLSFWDQLSKPIVLAVLLLLVGVVVLVFFPVTQRTEVASASQSETAAVNLALPTARPAPMATGNPDSTEVEVPVQASSLSAPLAMQPTAVASAASLSGTAVSALPVMVSGSGATTSMVVFKARGSSWVEVVDASGAVQLRRNMVDGEVVSASGVMPLSVVVGRVDTIEVQVRGKPFDLTGIAKDNVARFEVK